jgi:hypothetical protein
MGVRSKIELIDSYVFLPEIELKKRSLMELSFGAHPLSQCGFQPRLHHLFLCGEALNCVLIVHRSGRGRSSKKSASLHLTLYSSAERETLFSYIHAAHCRDQKHRRSLLMELVS